MKKWRLINEVSTKDLAGRIGIATTTLYNLERGQPVDAPTLMKLSNWLFTDEATGGEK